MGWGAAEYLARLLTHSPEVATKLARGRKSHQRVVSQHRRGMAQYLTGPALKKAGFVRELKDE
jgi:hypothetical protein